MDKQLKNEAKWLKDYHIACLKSSWHDGMGWEIQDEIRMTAKSVWEKSYTVRVKSLDTEHSEAKCVGKP